MNWIINNSDNNTQDINLVEYPYINGVENITINTFKEIKILGGNFSPDSEVTIDNTTISETKVFNNNLITVKVTSNLLGNHKVTVSNDNLSSDSWIEKKYLTVQPAIDTGWIDFRQPFTGSIQSTINQSSINNLSIAGLTTNTNGLTTTSAASQLFVAFPDVLVPFNGIFTYESISNFPSGINTLWTGLTRTNINWSNPRRACLVMNSIENRAIQRCFYGETDFYQVTDNVTGVNWGNNVIHTVITVDRHEILTTVYSRTSVNYDWNKASEGERLFSQYFQIDDLANSGYLPCVYFNNANSLNHLLAHRVSS